MRINEIHDEKKKKKTFVLEIFDYLIVFNLISLSLSTSHDVICGSTYIGIAICFPYRYSHHYLDQT
jgi:hypothetical protein